MRETTRFPSQAVTERLARWRRLFVFAGGVALAVAAAIGLATDRRMFFVSYLEGYLIPLGLTLGCLGIWMLHSLVGGQWGDPIDRIVQAAARSLSCVALLFLPVLFGLKTLFPWTDVGRMRAEEMLSQKIWYLNSSFFIGRAVFYFVAWQVILHGLRVRSERADKQDPLNPWTLKLQNWSGGGTLALFFTGSFAVIDWILSLDPHFYSTVWGALILMGFLLGSFSFCTAVSAFLHQQERSFGAEAAIPMIKLNDLGNLILMSLILWMYMTFSQYLIIWSGQIKAEVSWYNARFLGGWEWFGLLLLFGGFVVPFVCLLMRRIKRSARLLASLATAVLVMQWVWMVWLVSPSVWPMAIHLSWQTFVLPTALGLLWLGSVSWQLEKGLPPFPFGHADEVKRYAA